MAQLAQSISLKFTFTHNVIPVPWMLRVMIPRNLAQTNKACSTGTWGPMIVTWSLAHLPIGKRLTSKFRGMQTGCGFWGMCTWTIFGESAFQWNGSKTNKTSSISINLFISSVSSLSYTLALFTANKDCQMELLISYQMIFKLSPGWGK